MCVCAERWLIDLMLVITCSGAWGLKLQYLKQLVCVNISGEYLLVPYVPLPLFVTLVNCHFLEELGPCEQEPSGKCRLIIHRGLLENPHVVLSRSGCKIIWYLIILMMELLPPHVLESPIGNLPPILVF